MDKMQALRMLRNAWFYVQEDYWAAFIIAKAIRKLSQDIDREDRMMYNEADVNENIYNF